MQKQVFVKLDHYQEVLKLVKSMKSKITEAKMALHKVRSLKRDEDVELELWQSSLDQVDSKIMLIDASLQEPQHL